MILLTGATCPTGEEVLRLLLAQDFTMRIRCLSRVQKASQEERVEWCSGDIRNPADLSRAMDGVSEVIHVAGIHTSALVVREASSRKEVKRVIYVHTTSRFARHKAASSTFAQTEAEVMSAPVPYTILRASMVYGNMRDRNIAKLIDYLYTHRYFPVFGKGTNLFQPVHVTDLAHAIVAAYNNPGVTRNKQYNLPGQAAITYQEMLRVISSHLHGNTRFLHIPIPLALAAAHLYALVSKNPRITVEQVKGMGTDRAYDFEEARKDFGYAPRSFQEGVVLEIQEYLEQKGASSHWRDARDVSSTIGH